MNSNFKNKFNFIFSWANVFFIISLAAYLVFFLSEIMLHGFISQNFDLNILFFPIFIFGAISILSNKLAFEAKLEKDLNHIYQLIILFFASLVFGLLLLNGEIDLQSIIKALFGSMLIIIISFVLVISEKDEDGKTIYNYQPRQLNIKYQSFNKIKFAFLSILILPKTKLLKIRLVIPLVLIFFAITAFLFIGKMKNNIPDEKKPKLAVSKKAVKNSSLQTEGEEFIKKVPILVFNGGVKASSSSYMIKLLKENNFDVKEIKNADKNDYKNAIVRFRPEEITAAWHLMNAIKGDYPIIEKAPLNTQTPEIVLILGKPQ